MTLSRARGLCNKTITDKRSEAFCWAILSRHSFTFDITFLPNDVSDITRVSSLSSRERETRSSYTFPYASACLWSALRSRREYREVKSMEFYFTRYIYYDKIFHFLFSLRNLYPFSIKNALIKWNRRKLSTWSFTNHKFFIFNWKNYK